MNIPILKKCVVVIGISVLTLLCLTTISFAAKSNQTKTPEYNYSGVYASVALDVLLEVLAELNSEDSGDEETNTKFIKEIKKVKQDPGFYEVQSIQIGPDPPQPGSWLEFKCTHPILGRSHVYAKVKVGILDTQYFDRLDITIIDKAVRQDDVKSPYFSPALWITNHLNSMGEGYTFRWLQNGDLVYSKSLTFNNAISNNDLREFITLAIVENISTKMVYNSEIEEGLLGQEYRLSKFIGGDF